MDQRYAAANAVIRELLGKGGVQGRLEKAGLNPVDVDTNLLDYASFLIENNAPEKNMREELAAQLLSTMRTAEVMQFLRNKAFKEADSRGELPF